MFITTSDPRRRHRFLVEPLRSVGIEPILVKDTGSLMALFFHARRTLRSYPKLALVVLCDADIRMWVWAMAVTWFSSARLVVRVGGDPIKVRDNKITALKRAGDWISVRRMRLQQWASRQLFCRAFAYITVSEKLKNDLQGLAPNALSVAIPQVVNLERAVREDYGMSDLVRILTVTNLSYPAKLEGVQSVIKCMHQFVQTHEVFIEFTVLGGGTFEEPLRSWVEPYVSDRLRVRLQGFVNNTAPYYQASDIFVYFSNLEGLPNVVLEAQASGLPLLVNDDPLFFEFLEEGRHVLFYREHDSDDFALKLGRLIDSKELRAALGAANRARALERYSNAAVAAQLQAFFDQF